MLCRLSAVVVAAAVAGGAGIGLIPARQEDAAARVAKAFHRIEENRGATLWEDVRALEEAGSEGLDEIRRGLTRADAHVRVAAGVTLYRAGFRDEGLDALSKVYRESRDLDARRRAAQAAATLVEGDATLGGRPDQMRAVADRFRADASSSDDALIRVILNRACYALAPALDLRAAVRELFDRPPAPEVKDEAALALAQMDVFSPVELHLRDMAQRPGETGRLARAYLEMARDARAVSRRAARQAEGGRYALLDEVIEKLRDHYYDPARLEVPKLVDNAARGLLERLDPYTAYYDEKMRAELTQELEGRYGGIGARVQMRHDRGGVAWLTITEPIFSGPAYRAGLRSNDTIQEVEGQSTANRDLFELVRKLRGKPGTEVSIKVYRRGWTKSKDFTIRREEVQLDITMSEMLPGGLGYLKYSDFADPDDEMKLKKTNIEVQLQSLVDKGMKALILDLRGNSGGYLRAAERIAGIFLDDGTLILIMRAKDQERRHVTDTPRVRVDVPMVVLVDGGSASASEILAGALQDHKRALVVGERTFGKGTVQNLYPLQTLGGKTAARLTIAKWFLPSGRSVEREEKNGEVVQEGGLEPDVPVSLPERNFWLEQEYERIRADGKIDEYIAKKFDAHRATFERLAETDFGDWSKYPGFDELFDSLATKASKEEIRELVREYARKRVQEERQKAYTLDLQTDIQLQRAIIEACRKAGIEPKTVKEYGQFAAVK